MEPQRSNLYGRFLRFNSNTGLSMYIIIIITKADINGTVHVRP
jgi:hypothetical protein